MRSFILLSILGLLAILFKAHTWPMHTPLASRHVPHNTEYVTPRNGIGTQPDHEDDDVPKNSTNLTIKLTKTATTCPSLTADPPRAGSVQLCPGLNFTSFHLGTNERYSDFRSRDCLHGDYALVGDSMRINDGLRVRSDKPDLGGYCRVFKDAICREGLSYANGTVEGNDHRPFWYINAMGFSGESLSKAFSIGCQPCHDGTCLHPW